ncbi:universal stress protein [Flagellimonas sp. HMM57]|uniref:universal stress protein n=1 Tax=unclassified Flagellimonas TaxID=2644544 RepID=UPI0013D43B53|nr:MULTISPECIES: universal stress protein [unclassified Flagellimonas]UII76499.1 universal stress protein [Flagellimonas sp. HMM57]
MKLLEKILLAHDFSASSKHVEETAIKLGKVFHSKIIPIHVLPDDIVNEKVRTQITKVAEGKLRDVVTRLKEANVHVENPILEYGSPHDGIVRAGIRVNANMILSGSGESLQGGSVHLGTTTERIIQKSNKAVFVAKAGVPLNVHHILCPVDFSEASERALKNAIIMTRRFRAELTILSVCEVQSLSWFASEKDKEEENNSRLEQHKVKFDEFLKKFNLSDLNWTKETPKGNPAEEIRSAISRKMIDLLVMGTVGRSGLNRLIIGSVTEKVIREVPCSFLTLKSEDVIRLQLDTDIKDLEELYEHAQDLMKDGFHQEAIGQFEACLSINNMHVPAYLGIAKVHDKMKNPAKAEEFRKLGREIKDRMWYAKVEEEVRKLRGS